MRFDSVSFIVLLSLIPALMLETSTVHAQQTRYQVHTFSVRDLFDDEEFPEILNRSSANQTRSTIRSNTVSGATLIGTMPLWVFPASAGAALEPEFGPHASITGILVPEARLPCIPSTGSSEYQRLMGIRDQVYGEIVREFSQISHWLVGPETTLRFVDCEGKDLGIDDMVTFFVDTLEGLYPIIKRENSNARVIVHFLGDPWIPILIQGQLVQPRELRRRIREEIRQRAAAASNFYDVLVENLDPALVRNRAPENIPPVDFSTAATSPRDAVPNPCSTLTGWCVKWVEEFDVQATNLVKSYSLWNDWRTNTSTVKRTVMKVDGGRAQFRLTDPLGQFVHSIAGGSTTRDSSSGSDIVPDVEMAGYDAKRHRWTAVQDFYTAGAAHERAKVPHAAVFLRVQNRDWIPKKPNGMLMGSTRYPEQTRFGAFVYGPNPAPDPGSTEPDCRTSWCGTLEIFGDDNDPEKDPMSAGTMELFHFPLKQSSASEKHLWDEAGPMDTPSLYRVQIIEEKRPSMLNGPSMLYWKAQVWKNPGTMNAYLAGESNWVSQEELKDMYKIDTPGLTGSRISIGLGPLPSVCSSAARMGQEEADCIRENTPNPSIGIDVERVGTAYWRYSE